MPDSVENISRGDRLKYNALAFFTAAMWGLTFVSTKVLIINGLSPLWIFILRFIIAYVFILAISHKELWAKSLKDELWMVALGMTGGSVYFICENTALQYTFASNVSLIICATPVLTLFLCAIFFRLKIKATAIIGAVMALCGVTMIILNGSLNFGLSPLGDMLTLMAALLWAVYCIIVKKMNGLYSNLFITRKVFFYGFATALLFSIFEPLPQIPSAEAMPVIILNLAFLGIIASFACYIFWNKAVDIIGPEQTANYIYFQPIITLTASAIILQEPITGWLLLGTAIIITGVYLSSK